MPLCAGPPHPPPPHANGSRGMVPLRFCAGVDMEAGAGTHLLTSLTGTRSCQSGVQPERNVNVTPVAMSSSVCRPSRRGSPSSSFFSHIQRDVRTQLSGCH